jgi:hypothetical protein
MIAGPRETVPLTPEEHDAMIWLGEPIHLQKFVTEEMLRRLAAKGIVDYDPSSGIANFTPAGIQLYRDAVGHPPTRHV